MDQRVKDKQYDDKKIDKIIYDIILSLGDLTDRPTDLAEEMCPSQPL